MENEYVMELYNIRTNETIGYVYSPIRLVEDINSVYPMGKDFNVKIKKIESNCLLSIFLLK